MNFKKIAPWNWFKDEAPVESVGLPVHAEAVSDSLSPFRRDIERIFEDASRQFFAGFPTSHDTGRQIVAPMRPRVDISEGKKNYTVRAELPGVKDDDVSLEVEGNTLSIRAEKHQEREDDEEGYHCVERSYGVVQRVLSLPDDADTEAIDARLGNGVLELQIPKHAASAQEARTIEIRQE